MVEIKRNMGIMSNQVSRLRDEITGKELALAKDQQEHKRLEKNNDVLKVDQGFSRILFQTFYFTVAKICIAVGLSCLNLRQVGRKLFSSVLCPFLGRAPVDEEPAGGDKTAD